MKAKNKNTRRTQSHQGRARPVALAWRTGVVAMLLPLATGLSAQSTPRWDSSSPEARASAFGVYSSKATMTRVYPGAGLRVAPLAAGFNVTEFETLAGNLVAGQKVPGLAMAIVQGGRVLSARGYGITDVHQPETVDAHTVFRLASLSKSFAATAAGMLVADGKLRWDSRVVDYYPTLQLSDPRAALQLTVAEVLSHRVGVTRNAFDRDLERNAEYPALVQKLAYTPMKCAPGDCYAYQNIAYSLIGDVMQGASGEAFDQWVARRLFKPLGMQDASYGLEGILASPRWAKPHVRAGRGWSAITPRPAYYRVAPAAGVNASISDMAQWLLAQTGHRPDVLPAPLLATLHAPLIDTPSEIRGASWRRARLSSAGYALGWRVYNYSGNDVVFHGGAVQGYRGAMALLPGKDLGVVLLWNSESALPSGLLPTILDSALGLADGQWLDSDLDVGDDTLYAQPSMPTRTPAGADSSAATASPL